MTIQPRYEEYWSNRRDRNKKRCDICKQSISLFGPPLVSEDGVTGHLFCMRKYLAHKEDDRKTFSYLDTLGVIL